MTKASLVTLEHLERVPFWTRVTVGGAGECWEWSRGRSRNGYGVVHVGSGITGLPRPVAMYARNPAHLEEVAQLTNVRRGRKPTRAPRRRLDGMWSVRHYDPTLGPRTQATSVFPTEHAALSFIRSIRS